MSGSAEGLHDAVTAGNVWSVELLLRTGWNVNSRDGSQNTALHLACKSDHERMQRVVDLLLEAGADVKARDWGNRTALHLACGSEQVDMQRVVELLLEAGADVNARDCSERTALLLACESEHEDMQRVVDLLLDAGADVNARDSSKRTALHFACESQHEDMQRVVDLLLEAGADVNARDSSKRTALHFACESQHEDMQRVVDVLLKAGAEVNVQDKRGITPLHEACRKLNQSLVVTLLSNGADKSSVDVSGRTLLHVLVEYSVNNNAIDLINALLANSTDKGSEDRPSQHFNANLEHDNMLFVLNKQNSRGNTALHLACEKNNKEIVCLLLCRGIKVGVKNNNGMTALHMAVKACSTDVVNILVDNGEDVNAQNSNGDTVLHTAIFYGNKEVVCYLLRSGAKVDVKNKDGRTALHWAAKTRAEDLVYLLVDNGACVSAKDCRGNTPLHDVFSNWKIVTIGDSVRIANFLIIKGAKIDEQNIKQKTPYEVTDNRLLQNQKSQRRVEAFFITHVIRLKTLGLQDKFDINWRSGLGFYNNFSRQCFQELENMKSIKVVKDLSLYAVLSHTNQPFLSTDDVLHIDKCLWCPKLLIRFPIYGDTLRITFQRAKLLTLAVQSFYTERREQKVRELPYPVAEHLVTYLSNEDLRNFIKSDNFDYLSQHKIFKKMVEEFFITQVIRLKTLKLQDKFEINWRLGQGFYNNVRQRCFQELGDMKSIKVVKDLSLYTVLSHTNQPFLLSTEDVLHIDKFLCSSYLLKRFPLYGESLRMTFQRAKLQTLAVQSFNTWRRKPMVRELPYLVIKRLLTFLSDKDLKNFIKSDDFE